METWIRSVMNINTISGDIVDAAIQVHWHLGPGLLESAYQVCLSYELRDRGHDVAEQRPLPIVYRDVTIDCGYRLDMLVDDAVIVELKAVTTFAPVHKAQLLSYLRLSGHKLGLLINFHSALLKDGIVRMVNDI